MLTVVKSALLDRKLSQRELARALKINEVRLCRILRGRFRMRSRERRMIAEFLDLPVRKLFSLRKRCRQR